MSFTVRLPWFRIVAAPSMILTWFLTLPNLGYAAPILEWSALGEEDGVRIYRRAEPGTGLFEFRGVGVVNAGMAKIIALLSDASNMPRWLDGCISGELVEKNYNEQAENPDIKGKNVVFYAVNKAPWPLHNRDYVISSTVAFAAATSLQPAGLVIDIQSIKHPKFPPAKGLVRLPLMRSRIGLLPVDKANDKTEVDFSVVLDPGGILPAFIVNIVSHDLPLKTLLSLNELVKDQDYNRDIERMIQRIYAQPRPLPTH